MDKRLSLALLVAVMMFALILVYSVTDYGDSISELAKSFREGQTVSTVYRPNEEYLRQRNAIAKELNKAKKQFGQQSCEMRKLKKKLGEQVDTAVSDNGGWCAEFSGENSSTHMWDEGFSIALSKFLTGKNVGSFGDGPGSYKKHLDKLKEVKSYTAYDGAPFCESTTEGRVNFLDLSVPQYGLPAFDWVVSVEVGEHIPKAFQEVFMDNLARHAKEGIIMSWARPGQGGLSHVNNRPLEDVVASMKQRHFTIKVEEGAPLRNASSFPWLRNNIQVYRRMDPSTFKSSDL